MRVLRTSVRLVVAAAAVAVLGLVLAGPAAAAAPVAFVGQDSVAVVARSGVATTAVVVSNDGPEATMVWSVMLAGAPGSARVDVDPGSSSLPANGISAIDLTFRVTGADGPLAGYLVGTVGAASAPVVLPLAIRTFPFEVPFGPIAVIVASILLAAVWVLFCWWSSGRSRSDLKVASDVLPAWEPTSWATTITGAGGLLTLLMVSGAIPADTILFSRQEFAALALVFAALVALAPLAFVALRDSDRPGKMVVVAMALTTAGVLGQLATLDLLVVDALGQSGGPAPLLVLVVIAIACGLLVLAYVRSSMTATLAQGAAASVDPLVTWPLL